MTFWAYMLHCRGGTFYTGHTDDLERRMAQHAAGSIGGFVRDHWPAELVWSQEFSQRHEALAAERRIKGWSRAKKLALIRGDWAAIARLAKAKGSPSTSSGRTEVGGGIEDELRRLAALAHPNEACGLLLGAGRRIVQAVGTANVARDPARHFEIDPAALIAAHRAARAGGLAVIGYWHSHPVGAAEPSATDRAAASGDGRVWAIVADAAIGWWRDAPGGFEALSTPVICD